MTKQCCSTHAAESAKSMSFDDAFRLMNTMYVCTTCGNKRCPKATDCSLECTGSNEVGQDGSMYVHTLDWPSPERIEIIAHNDNEGLHYETNKPR